MNNTLKGRNQIILAICIVFVVMIMILAMIALRQKPTVANNDNTETENVIDTEDDTMTMVADGEDSTQNDTTESEDVPGTEDSETKEDGTDSQTPSSEEDEKDDTDDKSDKTDDKKDDESDDKKDDETDDTDDGKDDVDDSEKESEEPEDEKELSPSEQAVVNAGYGKVVLLPTGNYGVLVHNDGYANGKNGADILVEYLAAMDLEASSIGGCYIDADKDWYWYIARDVHERIDETDEEFWD